MWQNSSREKPEKTASCEMRRGIAPAPRQDGVPIESPHGPEQAQQIIDDIEENSNAIVRLLQTHGSSETLGPEQRGQFEKLLQGRWQLVAELENLCGNGGNLTRQAVEKEW